VSEKVAIVEKTPPPAEIRRAYDRLSGVYSFFVVPLKRGLLRRGLEKAAICSEEKVLEVAVGPGATLLEILRRVDRNNVVTGVDLSLRMLERARRRAAAAGFTKLDLRQADARQLPFADASFDVLFNSFMFDLLPRQDMPVVLAEFRRVLKPGGRLVLLSLSKSDPTRLSRREKLYAKLPTGWAANLLGGCRPVWMSDLVGEAGFENIQREFVPHLIPTEIITAIKPPSGEKEKEKL